MTIIGIAGGTGSGKTTVVKHIAQALPPHCVAVVPLDSYYNDTTGMTDEERRQINFDHPDAFDWKLLTRQIQALRQGKSIEQPTYSYLISNRLPETVHVEPCEVIIIEGIMALWKKQLRDLMDLKIFVDADPDERLIRVIQRDTVERGRTTQMVLDRYLDVLKPMRELIARASAVAIHAAVRSPAIDIQPVVRGQGCLCINKVHRCPSV